MIYKTTDIFDTMINLDDGFIRLKNMLENSFNPLKIVIFGKYNHGKSTFLNAWLKQNLFKTGDTRVTTQVQSYLDSEHHIIWIDTPGLDVDKDDDQKAIDTIKEADLVLLIHDAVAGELDKKELDFIRQYSFSNGRDKIRLLLTKIDQNEANLSQVMTLIKYQINDFNIEIFPLSALRYQKYIAESVDIWMEKSGFSALFLDIQKASLTRNEIRKSEVIFLFNYLTDKLNNEKNHCQNKVDQLISEKNVKQREFDRAAQHLLTTL